MISGARRIPTSPLPTLQAPSITLITPLTKNLRLAEHPRWRENKHMVAGTGSVGDQWIRGQSEVEHILKSNRAENSVLYCLLTTKEVWWK